MNTMHRPDGYREPTSSELNDLPEGSLVWCEDVSSWRDSSYIGMAGKEDCLYAVPITPASQPRGTDPKGEAGKTKCPLGLIPPYAMEETAWVHGLGASKYGAWNWRENKVCKSTYISAMLRHLNAYRSGEEIDPESGRSHLAHIAAGCNILMDAGKHGTLEDDLP